MKKRVKNANLSQADPFPEYSQEPVLVGGEAEEL
jgi:hypothetical protein